VNKNEILNEICNDEKYIDYCYSVAGCDLYKDLFQYVCLYLLEINDDKLIKLHKEGGLRMYVARIIYISIHSNRSEFKKQLYGKLKTEELPENINTNDDDFNDEEQIKKIESEIDKEITKSIKKNIYPAQAKLFEIYVDCGNYKEVSRVTGIPYLTVRKHIQSFQNKIKNKCK